MLKMPPLPNPGSLAASHLGQRARQRRGRQQSSCFISLTALDDGDLEWPQSTERPHTAATCTLTTWMARPAARRNQRVHLLLFVVPHADFTPDDGEVGGQRSVA